MRCLLFSSRRFEHEFMDRAAATFDQTLEHTEVALNAQTARLAEGFPAVCAFINDDVSRPTLEELQRAGVRYVALRSAGFNNVDVEAAEELGIGVARVPAYSPHAVAEHAVALMLTLNRKLHRAVHRVRDGNFELDGLLGFDMHGKTVGLVGTGKIGAATAKILAGFGCALLGYDTHENPALHKLGLRYVSCEELCADSDIISLHCPLTPQTRHLINDDAIQSMRRGVMLINTSRGAVVDTRALIRGLKSGHIGSVGLDVYEEEGDLFFRDLSNTVMQDDIFARLLTFPNVVITGHQGFFTREALQAIAETTMRNLSGFEYDNVPAENQVTRELLATA